MEESVIATRIPVYCIRVETFPAGIQQAFERLTASIPAGKGRGCYGVFYQDEKGKMVYKAAAAILENEINEWGNETDSIGAGHYLSRTIGDWRNNLHLVPDTFIRLSQDERVDHHSPDVEWYKDEKVLYCMLKMKNERKQH